MSFSFQRAKWEAKRKRKNIDILVKPHKSNGHQAYPNYYSSVAIVGGIRIFKAFASASLAPARIAAVFLASSTRLLASAKAGTIQAPQLHFWPCQAYRPTTTAHRSPGHSRRPARLPFSSSRRIQDSGSVYMWAHDAGDADEDGEFDVGNCFVCFGACLVLVCLFFDGV